MGGVQLGKITTYGRCPLRCHLLIYGRCPLTRGGARIERGEGAHVILWETPHWRKCLLVEGISQYELKITVFGFS